MTFKAGESGNPGGRKTVRPMREAIEAELRQEVPDPDDPKARATKYRLLARALVKAGLGGDIRAISEINDRVDGKVPQALTGIDDGPVQVVVRRFSDGEDKS